MNTNTDVRRQNDSLRKPVPEGVSIGPQEPSAGYRTEWRCPNCRSSELKRVSLAYEEGRSRLAGRTRLRGMIFGDDANVIVGTAVTNGIAQTQLSKRLRPPQKWSYGKLILGAGLAFLASLLILIRFVMASSAPVSSVGIVILGAIGLGTLVAMSVLIWGHNHLVYPTQHAEWNDSWVCQRCGGVSSQRLGRFVNSRNRRQAVGPRVSPSKSWASTPLPMRGNTIWTGWWPVSRSGVRSSAYQGEPL